MSATATKPRERKPMRARMTREQAAEEILKHLTEEPQSEASIRRKILDIPEGEPAGNGAEGAIKNGFKVLEARHEAKLVPRKGWVLFQSKHDAERPAPQEWLFPYQFRIVKFDEMFVDKVYQRPVTTLANKIHKEFDPVLFGALVLSDRGRSNKPRRYALMDGQTRWVGGGRAGVVEGPCIVFTKLTTEQEADIFSRLQTERRGMVSWHRFRAAIAAKNPEALAIRDLVHGVGYTLGEQEGQLRAVAALEACYRSDGFLLERALADLKDAWPTIVPEAAQIRGMHYFFRHFPIGHKKRETVNDERLVRRLAASGPDGLNRKAIAAKEAHPTGKGANAKFMATAIQNIYLSGGKS